MHIARSLPVLIAAAAASLAALVAARAGGPPCAPCPYQIDPAVKNALQADIGSARQRIIDLLVGVKSGEIAPEQVCAALEALDADLYDAQKIVDAQ